MNADPAAAPGGPSRPRHGRDFAGESRLRPRPKLALPWILGLAFLTILFAWHESSGSRAMPSGEEDRAVQLMVRASALVRAERAKGPTPPDPVSDPAHTGLIGVEYGLLTTSLGQLEAKRTAASPQMAALATRLLVQAGVRKGDCVAIGASGSFPGFVIAMLSASQSLGAHALLVCSAGSSTWGANDQDFNLFGLLGWLTKGPLTDFEVVLATPGGQGDAAHGLSDEASALMRSRAQAAGLPYWEPPTLREAIDRRMQRFRAAAGGRRIACYVNIGGSIANMGSGTDILALQPGLASVEAARVPRREWGVLHEMAAAGIPVIHLLNVRGLAARYGLTWDPPPWTETAPARHPATGSLVFLGLALLLLGAGWVRGRQVEECPSPSGRPS